MQKYLDSTLRTATCVAALLAGWGTAWAQTPPACVSGPPGQIWHTGMPYDAYPQPRPGMTPGYAPPSQVNSADGMTTTINTAQSLFPESDPWDNPTNLLPTIYHDVYDSTCQLVPNTTPSTPEHPYNLHPAPTVTQIDRTSPYDDLFAIIQGFHKSRNGGDDDDRGQSSDRVRIDPVMVQRAIDILEGNPVAGRMYSGMPVLHYNGPNKYRQVQPIKDANGVTVGGTLTVHLIYYRSHIESDTSLLDVSLVPNVPYTVKYIVDSLSQGADDFSPSPMYFDNPDAFGGARVPLVMMDLSFFPFKEGTRSVFDLAMAPGKYFNGTYTWGWRVHPGRVQFMENAGKVALGDNLLNWEVKAFGPNPMGSHADQVAAINKIGNLAPEKRMWNAFNQLLATPGSGSAARALVAEIEAAFDDWDHRGRLPRGVVADPNADITLFYANNTIYASVKGYVDPDAHMEYTDWVKRNPNHGAHVKVKLINGDYYDHGYMSVDFGGMRGWENTFQNTVPVGGDGPWFTFGREHWWPNVTPVKIPPAVPGTPPTTVPYVPTSALVRHPEREVRMEMDDPDGKTVPRNQRGATLPSVNNDILGEHWIDLTWNFDPSRRLRFYQFDPLHHDVAVFSMH